MAIIGHAENRVENTHSSKIAHISIIICVVIKSCEKHLCSKLTAILIFIGKHEFLYNKSCNPVCKLLSVFQKCQIFLKPSMTLEKNDTACLGKSSTPSFKVLC